MNIFTGITVFTGILGALLFSYGACLISPPAGFIVSGLLCLGWSYWASRMLAKR